eukprot:TRINITY_DN23662_c0_g1_i1.p1 TRINITY_DN23662_c0_g1~~TRINITY_DN23662_c0_g1_i1.p1  ORF type:complete len:836 (-),score=99.13 TRINITY_DN23662_c0_g1_i1:56-2563(-)
MRSVSVRAFIACVLSTVLGTTAECVDDGSEGATCVGDAEISADSAEAELVRGTKLLQKSIRVPGPETSESDESGSNVATSQGFEGVTGKLMDRDFDALPEPPAPRLKKDSSMLPHDFLESAKESFQHFMKTTGFDAELNDEETELFLKRFIKELEIILKHMNFDSIKGDLVKHFNWMRAAITSFKDMRPVVSQADVDRINSNSLGWTAEIRDWMKDVSLKEYRAKLGKVMPEGHKESLLLQSKRTSGKAMRLPASFESAANWPECESEIHRITNQGHCGSCWAFASMSVTDSRLCIASGGRWKSERSYLSRGYATSCATQRGCEGGLSSYSFALLGAEGVPTGGPRGCSPYFAEGEGTEHFQQSQTAPSCPRSCRPNYGRSLHQDTFKLHGIQNYQEFWNDSPSHLRRAKEAIFQGGPIPMGIYASDAFMSYKRGIFAHPTCNTNPNHETVALGFGSSPQEHIIGQNSWGSDWGLEGRFKIVDCVATDFTIPGKIDVDRSVLPFELPSDSDADDDANDGGGVVRTKDRNCKCRKEWTMEGKAPCTNYCCNPDSDPQGTWCFVEDTSCQGRNYGYCDAPTNNDRGSGWSLIEGPCRKGSEGCFTSSNWPSAHYGNNEFCKIDVGASTSPILVVDFNTESGYDKLTVNGVSYSGGKSPQGVVPRGTITWSSDSTVGGQGWKICPGDGGAVDAARRTRNGCKCKQHWTLQYHAPCNNYCCNPDHDARGEWCFVEDEDCEDGRNYGYCTPASLLAVDDTQGVSNIEEVQDMKVKEQVIESIRLTSRGCACLVAWTIEETGHACTDSCCNPDGDSIGAWCVVADASCEGRSWGHCAEVVV